ncbi:zinc ribbon domain-containing protein [Candidatus Solincola tengchongensis]|uniref:zinc ribbon domain-containing protein n=1 Tax=Candidatus Solincola tengchongensis TaxID=2900693 RepID=UPI00257B3F63|nr:zinc ribbon domain-containing protein [Candidatus Solincola tengchongensis]
MICPNCGAENADNAEFCTLCLQRLRPAAGEGMRPAGGGYAAPGEWRPDVVSTGERMRPAARERMRHFRLRMAIYIAVAAALVAWFTLSLTVWGNPQPGKRASQVIEALNARDEARFVSLFHPSSATGAERLFKEVTDYLGGGGSFLDLELRVEAEDPYTARVLLERGSIRFAGGEVLAIEPSDGLVIRMENREGRWLAVAAGTDLLP